MLSPIKIKFALEGVTDVTKAFSLIEDRMAKAEQAGTVATTRGAAARKSAVDKEVAEREKAYAKLVKSVEKDEKEAAKATEKSQGDATRSAEREVARRESIVRRSSEMAGRYAAQQANEEIREARRATEEIERENAKRAASHRATARSIGGAVVRGVGGVGRMATGMLSVGGGLMIADVGREELNAGRQAALLVNTVTTGKTPPPGATAANIMGQATQVATETGMNKTDIIGAALSYAQHAKGGDFRGAMGNMGFFARMAQTTGADINELAMSAGTLQSQNQKLGPKEMQQMLLDVYAQSKMGSMSMSDVAKQMGTLGSTRSNFTGDVTRNQRELFALGQIVAPGGDVAEAGIFTKDFASEAIKGGKKHAALVAAGVKFDEKSGRLAQSPAEVLAQVIAGTHGNVTKLQDIFEGRGGKLTGELVGTYQDAGGGAKGLAAVKGAIASVTDATMTPEQLDAQHAQSMSEPLEKLNVAVERVKAAFAEELSPWIDRFADSLPSIVGYLTTAGGALGDFAKLIVDNPVPAALTLLATKMGGTPGEIAGALAASIALIDWQAAADRAMQKKDTSSLIGGVNATSQLNAKVRDGTVTAADVQAAEQEVATLRSQAKRQGEGPGLGATAMALGASVINPALGADALVAINERKQQDARAAKAVSDQADLLATAIKNAAKKIDAVSFNTDPARVHPMGAERP
jgi:hypothetical protein